MTNTMHTPSPWRADRRSIVAGNGVCIAEVFSGAAASLAEADANEHLIAAAPELLEAALAAAAIFSRQKWLPQGTDPEAVALRLLNAAIAKATGPSSPADGAITTRLTGGRWQTGR